ncbi:MAG: sugar ABC transporter permease [Lachnospiraceae bacterium]|nr:sugar ABC transporter permease [Lachnospiraceae bacterium]MCI9592497.1 sugar ABC transporter permease [Lachnospiraceae bacterium]
MLNSDNKRWNLFLFSIPFLAMYFLFFLTPMVMGLWYSFTDWNGMDADYAVVGLDNFMRCFKDERFFQSFGFTFRYAFLYTAAVNCISLGLAAGLSKNSRRNQLLRGIFFAPNVLNLATIGFMWQFILGTLNIGLYKKTGWDIFQISWLNDKKVILYTVTLVRIWVSAGYNMIIYIAGIQGIDSGVREAAVMDGAGGMSLFRYVTLPLIMPALTSGIFLSLINSLKIFPLLMTLTQGGPGYYSESVSLNIYREAFETYRFGYASAKAILFTLVILAITGIQLRFFKKKEDAAL